jgi:hypothetical protein
MTLQLGPTCLSLVTATALLTAPNDVRAQEAQPLMEARFEEEWQERWSEVKLARRANRFTTETDTSGAVLRAESERAASALWYRLDLGLQQAAVVSWRWKVASALTGNDREREKRGDDYAARFFVIFDDEPFSRGARAICYVWATNEPVGSEYRNPYFSSVQTVVLQSGNGRAGAWMREERNFLQDYRAAFGEEPKSLTALAVMVDTDNTEANVSAWFGDIAVLAGGSSPPTDNPGN